MTGTKSRIPIQKIDSATLRIGSARSLINAVTTDDQAQYLNEADLGHVLAVVDRILLWVSADLPATPAEPKITEARAMLAVLLTNQQYTKINVLVAIGILSVVEDWLHELDNWLVHVNKASITWEPVPEVVQ